MNNTDDYSSHLWLIKDGKEQANIPVYLFVIMTLLLIIKDNKNMINKQNNTSSYNMSVRITDPYARFFFCSQSSSI